MYRRRLQELRALNEPKSRFVHRITSIPAVLVTCNILSQSYVAVKCSNVQLKVFLTKLETAGHFIGEKSFPLAKKLQPQLKIVDNIMFEILENFSALFTIIWSKPVQITRYSMQMYNEMVESGLRKYDEVKTATITSAKNTTQTSIDKSNEFLNSASGQSVLRALNIIFDSYEKYLDYVLPPLGDESLEQPFGDRIRVPVFERADILTERFKERFYKHLLLKIQNLKLRIKIFIRNYRSRQRNSKIC